MYDAGLLPLDDTTNELRRSHDHVQVPATKDAANEHKLRIEEHDPVPDDQSEFASNPCSHGFTPTHMFAN